MLGHFFDSWQIRVFLNPQDLLCQFHEAALGRMVILAVYEATSVVASTNIVDLETVPEVDKMK